MPTYTYKRDDLVPLYTALGEFLVEFQMTCWQIRFCYLNLLKRHGLTDVSLAGMMVHSKDMSESLLIDSFRSAHLKAFDDDETRSQVKIAHKRFRKLLEERNRIVHGTWWLGEDVIVMADSSKTHGFKTVRRDAGVEYDPLPNLEESNALIGKTKKLRIAFTVFPSVGGNPDGIRKLQARQAHD